MTAQTRTATGAPHVLRDVAEKSEAQAKDNLEKMSAAAGEASNLLKTQQCDDLQGHSGLQRKGSRIHRCQHQRRGRAGDKIGEARKWPMEFFALSNDYAKRQFEKIPHAAGSGTRRNRPENDPRRERPLGEPELKIIWRRRRLPVF